jgi:predicted phosphate transport protein (TIGR00153 family)
VFSVIPRDTKFFDLFENAARVMVKAAEAYADLGKNYANRDELIPRIRQFEHDGDEVTHRTLDILDKTFITPFDREDIQRLIVQMDDVVDEIDAAAKRLVLYRIETPTPWLVKQTEVLVKASKLIGEALPRLRNFKKLGPVHEHLVEIHRLENVGDDNNHAAVADLYNHATDPILAMKWKEIYDITERAIDTCEDVANTIEGIILKNS